MPHVIKVPASRSQQNHRKRAGQLDVVWDFSLPTAVALSFVTGEIFTTALLITFLI
jgi:hypothetical protein